jgi:hypothetical protein
MTENDTPEPSRYHPIVDRMTVLVFALVLCAPVAARVFHLREDPDVMRFDSASATPPALSFNLRSPRELERYFHTHFVFREELTSLHARMKVLGFGTSGSDVVVIGKQGWLFYSGEEIVDDYRRVRPFDEDELAGWTHLLVARRDWLRARGIPFLFFIVPNQQTIYPEFMPDWMTRENNPSRLDQLIGYLKMHTDLDVIDLRPSLLAAKTRELVYYKTDSHWNQAAGFIAYREIEAWMERHFTQWRPLPDASFRRVETPDWHGGLSYLLGEPSLFGEQRLEIVPLVPDGVTSDGMPLVSDETMDAWTRRRLVERTSPDGEIPRAVVFRDSMMAAPAQFLSRHFQRMVLAWSRVFDSDLITREHPDVVIEEFAERFLMEPIPTDPAIMLER